MAEEKEDIKVVNAEISDTYTKYAQIFLIAYIFVVSIIIILLLVLGFVYGSGDGYTGWFSLIFSYKRYYSFMSFSQKSYAGNIVLFVFIMLILIAVFGLLPYTCLRLIKKGKDSKKLIISATKVVGEWTVFIPVLFLPIFIHVTRIKRIIPTEKIDNVTVAESKFFLYTGKAIEIKSTSGKIDISYVTNADDVVNFVTEMVESYEHLKCNEGWSSLGDIAESIKKLSELKEAGIITEEEFNKKKNELLNKI